MENLPIRESQIEDTASRLIAFIEFFTTKQTAIQYLNKAQLVTKFEEQHGILFELKRDTTSLAINSLHMILNRIINRNFAIPKNTQDEIAFNALGLLGSGIDTYIEVMNFLLQGHTYLADHYHQ